MRKKNSVHVLAVGTPEQCWCPDFNLLITFRVGHEINLVLT